MKQYKKNYAFGKAVLDKKIIDLPKSQYTIRENPPRKLVVYKNILAIVAATLIFLIV